MISIRPPPRPTTDGTPYLAKRVGLLLRKGMSMLVLSRRLHEKIVLPGIGAIIEVVAIKPGVVRIGIDAPSDVTVLREEVTQLNREPEILQFPQR